MAGKGANSAMTSVIRQGVQPSLWHVGGIDVYARIPILQALSDGFRPSAIGSGGSDRFSGSAIPFHQYYLDRGFNPSGDLRSIAELTRLFAAHTPDIVHAFDTKPAIYAMIAARRAGVAVRLRTVTGLGYLFSQETLATRTMRVPWGLLQRRAAAAAHWTVFQNKEDREEFVRRGICDESRSGVIPGSGIDVPAFERAMGDEVGEATIRQELGLGNGPVFLMAARLVVQKGVREYLQAAARLQAAHPTAQFLLAGARENEGRNAITAGELAAQQAVRWIGERTDLAKLMRVADYFVLPSAYGEGVPRVLLEAGLAGCGLITTRMPGCKDVVLDDKTGFLVPPNDASALFGAMERFLGLQPEERAAFARITREHIVGKFSLGTISAAYRTLYSALLDEQTAATGRPKVSASSAGDL
jgi:glycosyltransferase involved in cell wall biosynthesis